MQKAMVELTNDNKSEEDIIREVAEEEGLSYEDVKSIWDTFKTEASTYKASKTTTKSKRDKTKAKSNKKQAKKSRKKNR